MGYRNFRNLKLAALIFAGLWLAMPGQAVADARDVPGSATWYLHVDLDRMRKTEAGKGVHRWMVDEIFSEIKEESGIDVDKELDRLTAYSLEGQGPVFLFEGPISQESKDRLMTLIAVQGDLQAQKASGKSYYRFTGNGGDGDDDNGGHKNTSVGNGNIEVEFDSLENEAWISMALDKKLIVTSSEEQMKEMLKGGGKIAGSGSHKGALLVLTAEKTLLQAGMNSAALGKEGDSGWDSNILRNTEQVAFLVAAADKNLALEAQLTTKEPDMAQSLASVVRGLISLLSFSEDLDADAIAVLQGTRVEAKGNNLTISLAIDSELLVSTLSD
jgi:hypothetical protein